MAKLTTDQAHFVVSVSQATGIDPRVLVAWLEQEGADAPNGTGGYNYLNLRATRTDGHTGVSPKGFAQFSNVNAAISATITTLNEPQNRIIINAAKSKPTPGQQIAAIAASPWDSSHYGGKGQTLIAEIESIFGGPAVLTDRYEGPGNAAAVAATAGTGSAADWTSYDAGNAAHDIASPFESLYSWLTGSWQRILFVVAGAILVIIALLLIANSAKSNTFTFKSSSEG